MTEQKGGDYRLCDWRVRSTLPLPEVTPWTGETARPPDIVIAEAELPDCLDGPGLPSRALMVGRDGTVLLHIPGLVRLLVRAGREILVHRLGGDAERSWRLFALGPGLDILCHQRAILPLHAAGLRRAGKAVAIAGRRGSGKSTLALTLAQRGYDPVSDDSTAVTADGKAMVLPAYPRLKLWRPALVAAGVDIEGLDRLRDGLEKYGWRPAAGFDPAPAPLGAVVILDEAPEPSLIRLSPEAARPALHAQICRQRIATLMGCRDRVAARVAALADTVPVYRLRRPKRFDRMAETAALIEDMTKTEWEVAP